MAGLTFDDLTSAEKTGTQPSGAMSFEDLASPQPSDGSSKSITDLFKSALATVSEAGPISNPLAKNIPDIPALQTNNILPDALKGTGVETALGLLAQPGRGVYTFGSMIGGSLLAGWRTIHSRIPGFADLLQSRGADQATVDKYKRNAGLSIADTFIAEYNSIEKNLAEAYVPVTSTDAAIGDAIGRVLESGISTLADHAFETGAIIPSPGSLIRQAGIKYGYAESVNSPAAAAISKAISTLGLLAAPLGGKGMGNKASITPSRPAFTNFIDEFAAKYPETASALDASRVGKVRVEPGQSVIGAFNDALNKELGIAAENATTLTTGDKISLLVAKLGPEIPLSDRQRIANSYVSKIVDLSQADLAMQADQKLLPPPTVFDKPIIVTQKGLAFTPEQATAMDEVFLSMSAEERADALGISAMGRLRIAAEEVLPKKDTAPKEYASGVKELEKKFNKVFDYPKNMAARKATFQQFIQQDGRMSFDDANQAIGPRAQRGALDVSGLDKTFENLKDIMKALPLVSVDGMGREVLKNDFVTLTRVNKPMQENPVGGERVQYNVLDSKTMKPIANVILGRDGQTQKFTDLYDIYTTGVDRAGIGERVIASILASNQGVPIKIRNMSEEAWPFWKKIGVEQISTSPLKGVVKGDGILQPGAYIEARSGSVKGVGPGKSQRGAFDIEGIDTTAKETKNAVGAAATKAWTLNNPNDAIKNVEKTFDASFQASAEGQKISAADMLKRTRRAIVAHDYDLRAELNRAGEYGLKAEQRLIVQSGATMAAKTKMNNINEGIFDSLSREDKGLLDRVVRARRIIQIDAYKGVGVVRHEGGVTGPAAELFLQNLEKKLGSDRYNAIDSTASKVFNEHLKLLGELRDNGLIDGSLYDKLKNLDYQRTEYLDAIDPAIPISSHMKDLPQSIRSSGIPLLGRGKRALVEMDSQAILAEDVARVENRVAKNTTLKALVQLAKENPENGAVKLPGKQFVKEDKNGNEIIKSVPEGWTAIGVRTEGLQHNLLMRDDLAEQFISRPEPMPEWVATVFRYGSGSQTLKMSATAYNPTFVVAGIPMDILHTWLATANQYSPHLPKFLMQMGKDMAVTAHDAFTRTGRYEQAMLEGLGSSFLTHESRGLTGQLGLQKPMQRQMLPRWEHVKNVLAYANETADIWVRIAHRERLIQKGMASWEATALARDRLDFYQGGFVTRAVDTMIPYTNVAVQSFAKVAKAANADKAEFAIKLAWLTGTLSSIVLANMISSPETWKQISTRDKVRNIIFTFGDQYYVLDPEGNKRYLYGTIRLDSTSSPVQGAIVGGLELAEYGKAPDQLLLSTVEQFSPLVGVDLVPSLSAIYSYASNYNGFTGRPIYSGPKVLPQDEIRTFGQGQPTSEIAKAAGQVTGASPMRLEAAAGKVLNMNNTFIQAAGGSLRYMMQGMTPREQSESTLHFMTRTPFGSVVKLTSPATNMMAAVQKAEQEAGSKKQEPVRKLDDLVFQMQHHQGITTQNIETFINSQPEDMRKDLIDHMKITMKVDQVMRYFKASDNIPPKAWWIATAKASPEVRAQLFYNVWLSAPAEDRQRMFGLAKSLDHAKVGYISDDFMKAFRKEQQLLGTDQR